MIPSLLTFILPACILKSIITVPFFIVFVYWRACYPYMSLTWLRFINPLTPTNCIRLSDSSWICCGFYWSYWQGTVDTVRVRLAYLLTTLCFKYLYYGHSHLACKSKQAVCGRFSLAFLWWPQPPKLALVRLSGFFARLLVFSPLRTATNK